MPPILLCEHTPAPAVVAQQEEWDRLISLYGPLNPLQQEEGRVLDKMAYLIAHYMEASVRQDVVTKSVVSSLSKKTLLALAALNADDYTIRELAVDSLQTKY